MDVVFSKLHSGHGWWGTLQHNCSFNGRDMWFKPCWLIMCQIKWPKIRFYRNKIKIILNMIHRNSAAWVSCCWTKERSLLDTLCIPHHLVWWDAWEPVFEVCSLIKASAPPKAGLPQHCRDSGQQVPGWRITRASPRTQSNTGVPSFSDSAFLQNTSVVWGQFSSCWGVSSTAILSFVISP